MHWAELVALLAMSESLAIPPPIKSIYIMLVATTFPVQIS